MENMPNDIREIEIDRFDQEVIAYTVGGRSKKALKKLLRLLKLHRITQI